MPAKINTVTNRNKIENNRPASNYRHYRFISIRKQYGRRKNTDITDITVVTDFIENGIGRIMVGCSRCTYPSIQLSFHCADTLKITVSSLVCGVWCVLCVCMWRVWCGCVCTCGVVCGVGGVCVCCGVVARVCGVW